MKFTERKLPAIFHKNLVREVLSGDRSFLANERVKIVKKVYCTFFTNKRTEFIASTTSLSPIINAP